MADGSFNPKEGDIVFQYSNSSQSNLILWATGSRFTHCGIVVYEGIKAYVLEASNVVKLTPFNKWVDKSRFSQWEIRRVVNRDIKIDYKKYLGKKYDLAFSFDNDKYYCSELVYDIYLNQFGIRLAEPRKVKEYNTLFISEQMKKRGISEEQYVVAPSDLLESDKLFTFE